MPKLITAGIFFVACLGLGLVQADEKPSFGRSVSWTKWWENPAIIKELPLSQEEQVKIGQLYLEMRRRGVDLAGALEKERLDLDALFEQPEPDEAAVMAKMERISQVRNRLIADRYRFIWDIRKVLGRDRYQKLKVMFSRFNL